LFRETLCRLPGGCLAFQPAEVVPLPAFEPFEKNKCFTFGSFNNPSKVSPSTLAAWGQILAAVPTSRLQVRYAKAFRSGVLRERWLDRLCCSGVAPDRIQFITNPFPYRQHLETFTNVDLCLDPFPYQGTMTTLESLYMGSPVLTKAGRNYCQRASSSLLLRLGESQLVTGSLPEYIEKAIEFARFPDRLRPIRTRIRERFRSSSVCSVTVLGQELLEAYGQMWERFCTTGMPRSGVSEKPKLGQMADIPRRVPVMTKSSADSANTVWIASYPKSGNTWVRFLLTNLLCPDMKSSADVEALIPDVHKTKVKPPVVHGGFGFAKTHFLPDRLPTGHQTVGAVYVCRDPLDVLASHVNYFELAPGAVATMSFIDSYLSTSGPPRWAELGIGSWEEHIRQWCLTPQEFPVLAVSYESMQVDTHAVLRKIIEFLGIPASESAIATACQKSAADSLRQLEASEIADGIRGFFSSERRSKSPDFRFVNAARSDRAMEMLPKDVIERAERRFGYLKETFKAGFIAPLNHQGSN
ncbi:MAG: sulfotransferase domain-containing protein, partial [Planctomycetaceae bacterium]|nr:sulfotransferase domain-containing protein [Planctomycetaceae bacterium]